MSDFMDAQFQVGWVIGMNALAKVDEELEDAAQVFFQIEQLMTALDFLASENEDADDWDKRLRKQRIAGIIEAYNRRLDTDDYDRAKSQVRDADFSFRLRGAFSESQAQRRAEERDKRAQRFNETRAGENADRFQSLEERRLGRRLTPGERRSIVNTFRKRFIAKQLLQGLPGPTPSTRVLSRTIPLRYRTPK